MRNPFKLFGSRPHPLKSSRIYETRSSTFWLEGNLVYVIVKGHSITLSETKEELYKFKRLLRGRQLTAIIDFCDARVTAPEVENYLSEQLPVLFNAVALINCRVNERFLTPVFNPSGTICIPTKTFNQELDALCWVNQFIPN